MIDLSLAPPWFPVAMALWLGVLGAMVGSFLNVVIARVPEGLSVVKPRSRCPRCGHSLPWYENIPVLSWILLRAKCSGCKLPISVRYPFVELLTALLFVACLRRFDWTYALLPSVVFACLLLSLAFIDADHWILPFSITVPGMIVGVLLAIPNGFETVVDSTIGLTAGFVSLRFMEFFGWKLFRKEALGGGDKFLFAMIGAFVGWTPLLGVLLLASIQGAVFGIASILLTGRAGPKVEGQSEEPNEEAPLTMSWAFLAPGLTLGQRLAKLPYSIFLQPIPDDPPAVDGADAEPEWQPGATNLPFGPWLALGALELMLLGPVLAQVLPGNLALLLGAG